LTTVKRWGAELLYKQEGSFCARQLNTVIDEWVGGLGAPLAQWEVMRLVPPE